MWRPVPITRKYNNVTWDLAVPVTRLVAVTMKYALVEKMARHLVNALKGRTVLKRRTLFVALMVNAT